MGIIARMRRTLVAIGVVLVASAGEGAAPPQPKRGAPAELQGTARDFDSPPAGTPEDQALWRASYAANNDVTLVRGAAARLQQRATAGQYQQRLEALEKGPPDVAGRAAKLEGRLRAEWTRSFEIAARQWPVDPTRACRYPMLSFESAMLLDEGPQKAPQLSGARKDLQDCLGKAQLAIGSMGKSNQDFEAVLVEVERFLAAAPGAAAGGEAPPAGASQ
jgi:hypothetical protein